MNPSNTLPSFRGFRFLLSLVFFLLSFGQGVGLAADSSTTPPEPVRFLMYNVRNYFVAGEAQRAKYRIYPKPDYSKDAVADVIASVKPEIVGLIEMGGTKALEDLRQRLQIRGLSYPYYRVLERQGEDRALALLSQYPIAADKSKADYGLYNSKKMNMLRGLLDVTVKHQDGRQFRIIGAHIKSRVTDDEAAATSLRTAEAKTIAMHVAAAMKESPKLPILVYGDWNDSPSDESLRILSKGISADSALTRLAPKDSTAKEWTLYYKQGDEYFIFDQIYLNKVMKSRRGSNLKSGVVDLQPATKAASDHRAVWCEIR